MNHLTKFWSTKRLDSKSFTIEIPVVDEEQVIRARSMLEAFKRDDTVLKFRVMNKNKSEKTSYSTPSGDDIA